MSWGLWWTELREVPMFIPCLSGTYNLLLTDNIWQRWWNVMGWCHSWDVTICDCYSVSVCVCTYIFLLLWHTRDTSWLFPFLVWRSKLLCCELLIERARWWETATLGVENSLQPTARGKKNELQSYNHKETNSAKTWESLEVDVSIFIPQMRP